MSRFEDFFDEVDKDGSGCISKDELASVLLTKGFTEKQIQQHFRQMDTSNDGKITKEEYMIAIDEIDEPNKKAARFRRTFNEFDKDGSGEIDRSELKKAFAEMNKDFSDAELKRMVELVDADQSGTINCKEFCKHCFGVDTD